MCSYRKFNFKYLCTFSEKKYLTKISIRGGGFYETAIGINGVGQLANEFSYLTNELTGRSDIRCTTLKNWSAIIPTRGLLKKIKSWCPKCYEESKLNNGVVYDQLIWNFQLVDYCMKHKTSLVNTCENCSSTMPVINRTSSPGFCSRCENWLGTFFLTETNESTNDSLLDISLIGELLANNELNFTYDSFLESLNFYINEVFDQMPFRAATFFKIPKSTFGTWICGKTQPNIKYLIQICKMLGISIIEFFQMQKANRDESSFRYHGARQTRHNHLEIQNILKKVIENKEPVSISEVSRLIGCDRKLLSSLYRADCDQIMKNYNDHLQHNKNERLSTKTNQLSKAFYSLVEQSVYPSRRRLEEILGIGFLKEKALQEYWKELKKGCMYDE